MRWRYGLTGGAGGGGDGGGGDGGGGEGGGDGGGGEGGGGEGGGVGSEGRWRGWAETTHTVAVARGRRCKGGVFSEIMRTLLLGGGTLLK